MRCTLAILASWILLGFAQSAHSAQSIVDRPQRVCTDLAGAANSGSLARSVLQGHRADDPTFPVPEEVSEWGELTFKDLIDINNDGKAEYVYVVQYPPRQHQDESSTILELRIIEPFSIPQSEPRQQLFVFDQTMQRIEIEPIQDDAKALRQDADGYRLLRHGSTYYVVALNGDDLRYVQKFDGTNTAQPVCAFEQYASGDRMRTRALTTYRWLVQSFEQIEGYPGMLWLYAFGRDDLEVAQLLAKNGRSVNERIGDDTLLVWAIKEERADVIDWLLKHGADPSLDQRGDAPLELAIRDDNIDLAVKLMKLGADPEPLIEDIVRVGDTPEQRRSLMVATIDSLGYVPEEFVLDALESGPSLLDSFVARRVPVRPMGISWHAGEPMPLPFSVDRYIHGTAANSAQAIERLFKYGTIAASGSLAFASYGSYAGGVQVIRLRVSDVSDDDFRSLATALCYYFMPFDCGSEELVTRARAWADAQRDDCPARLRSVLNEQACRVAGYYSRHRDTINAYHISADGSFDKGDFVVEWMQFLGTYRAKHVQ